MKKWKYCLIWIEGDIEDRENNEICSSSADVVWQDVFVFCVLQIFPLGHKILIQLPLSQLQ